MGRLGAGVWGKGQLYASRAMHWLAAPTDCSNALLRRTAPTDCSRQTAPTDSKQR